MASPKAKRDTERREAYLRALLDERRQCEIAGKKDRVKAIDEELGDAARDAKPPTKRAEKRPASSSRSETR